MCSAEVAHNKIFQKWDTSDIITKDEIMLMDDLGLKGADSVGGHEAVLAWSFMIKSAIPVVGWLVFIGYIVSASYFFVC